ncbi:MAG: glucose ABC transporter permease GlcU [Thermoplasmataceae archaeon]|jgi:glucose/arabinose transport system permease protein
MNRKNLGHQIRRVLNNVILIILGALWLIPAYALLIDGLKTTSGVLATPVLLPAAFSFGAMHIVIDALSRPILNSLLYVLPVAVISTFVGSLAAYYFYKVTSFLNSTIFTIIAIATFVPYQITLVPLIKMVVSLGIFNSTYGLIFAFLIFYLPTGALLMSIFIAVLPKTTLESARVDGAGDFTVFRRIVVPLTLPGMISTFIFILIETWNNFFIPLVLISSSSRRTAAVALLSYTGGYGTLYNESFAAAFISSLIPLAIFILLGRYFVRGLMAFGSGAKG